MRHRTLFFLFLILLAVSSIIAPCGTSALPMPTPVSTEHPNAEPAVPKPGPAIVCTVEGGWVPLVKKSIPMVVQQAPDDRFDVELGRMNLVGGPSIYLEIHRNGNSIGRVEGTEPAPFGISSYRLPVEIEEQGILWGLFDGIFGTKKERIGIMEFSLCRSSNNGLYLYDPPEPPIFDKNTMQG